MGPVDRDAWRYLLLVGSRHTYDVITDPDCCGEELVRERAIPGGLSSDLLHLEDTLPAEGSKIRHAGQLWFALISEAAHRIK
jgi:hypothetical protein